MTAVKPTTEQQKIIEAATSSWGNLVIEAGAGTGKTSTLKMLAAAKGGERGLYVAYNRAIADDARGTFPASTTCATAHSLAYRVFGRQFAHRLNGPRIPARQAARILKLDRYTEIGQRVIMPGQVARLAMETVARFCYSAARQVEPWHVPHVTGLDDDDDHDTLTAVVLPIARWAWSEDLTRRDGQLKFTHDMYLKLWQLSGPMLGFDYVLLDEAQDANPVIADVVGNQTSSQLILVGDRCQSIYGWRGAVDAMDGFDGRRLQLTQSFRFGQAVADEANVWLDQLDAGLRLSGYEPINSRVGDLDEPDAVLCRSNAQAIAEVIRADEAGRKAALVGGGGDIRRLAEAASSLLAGVGTDHPELFAFRTWSEVRDYVAEDATGSDLKVLVKIIDRYGPEAIVRLVDGLAAEADADLVISTAHKAKGREWDTVRVADDFREPSDGADLDRAEAMLAYVAITRARLILDNAGLAWVHRR